MRVVIRIDISDELRHALAVAFPELEHTKKGKQRKVTRKGLSELVTRKLGQLDAERGAWVMPRPLTDAEKREASDAISYLRAAGKSDEQISAWLLKQRARAQFESI